MASKNDKQPLRERLKTLSFRLFSAGDRFGVHVLPAHYYSSLPSWRWLRTNEEKWRRPLTTKVVATWNLEAQAAWVREHGDLGAREFPQDRLVSSARAVGGLRFGVIEAQLLYGVCRRRAPRRIVEIGSGSSTMVMSEAVQRNIADGGGRTEIVALDPFMADVVRDLPHVQSSATSGIDVEASTLGLRSGDLLFIDSTHAVRTGSEVPHLYLEVLPRLPAGVLVHIHDIYLPYLFSPRLYETYFDWQETALVAALLVGNSQFRVEAGLAALASAAHPCLSDTFPDYRPAPTEAGLITGNGHYPSSLWLQTVGDGLSV